MLKKRLIPVLFLKNGLIVRSEGFVDFRELGNPINQLERLNDWEADELIYVDITREGEHDAKRDDHKIRLEKNITEILKAISKQCFMPLTFGGRINNFDDAARYISSGADKVIINTAVFKTPGLITEVANHFGSQCVVVGIDVKKNGSHHEMWIDQGHHLVSMPPEEWAVRAEALGAGEIFINSIDRDGSASGYDLEIIERIASRTTIPVIACGGAGSFSDFVEVFRQTSASAVAAGNIFNFTENAYPRAKNELIAAGCAVKPIVKKIN